MTLHHTIERTLSKPPPEVQISKVQSNNKLQGASRPDILQGGHYYLDAYKKQF